MIENAGESGNTPSKGLTLDQAFAQLKASRDAQAPEPEQLDDDSVEVEDTEEDDYDFEDGAEEGDDLDAEESEESEEPSEDDVPEVWTVEIDGEEVEVTTEELHKGYLRHNDYTKKRQADAKRAKELEAQYATKLSQLDQALRANVSAEEAQYNRILKEYQSATDEGTKRSKHYQLLQLQQNINTRKQALANAENARQMNAQAAAEAYWAEQEEQLRIQYEDWDTKKEELKGYLEGLGFEDLSMFGHAKMADIVDKARQFDELQQKRKKVVSKKIKRKVPSVVKPGQGEKKFSLDRAKIAALEARFAKTGNLKDAQALLRAKRGQ